MIELSKKQYSLVLGVCSLIFVILLIALVSLKFSNFTVDVSDYEQPETMEYTPVTIESKLPYGSMVSSDRGNGWFEVTMESGFQWQCFLYNKYTEQITLLYNGLCGNPEPKYKAEVTITSDDVLNAITGKKLIFLSKKDVKVEEETDE